MPTQPSDWELPLCRVSVARIRLEVPPGQSLLCFLSDCFITGGFLVEFGRHTIVFSQKAQAAYKLSGM